MEFISIHALREEGDRDVLGTFATPGISIHALREEGDAVLRRPLEPAVLISIHALREEGDACGTSPLPAMQDFYPRPPRGGRRYDVDGLLKRLEFLSTPSARRATGMTLMGC